MKIKYNEIDLINNPVFNFSQKPKKDIINIVKDSNKAWNVKYGDKGILNTFDYDIFIYIIQKAFPFTTNEIKIKAVDLIKDLKLYNNKNDYDRILLSLEKLTQTLITTKEIKYNAKKKKKEIDYYFHIIDNFKKIEIDNKSIGYVINLNELIVTNLKEKYIIFHNYDLKLTASNQLLFYLIYHKHFNKEIIISYEKILELLQMEKRKYKSHIEQQINKYFEDIKSTGFIINYLLYSNKEGKYCYKITYNLAPETKIEQPESKKDFGYSKLKLKDIIMIIRKIKTENPSHYKSISKWKDKSIRKQILKDNILEYLKSLEQSNN